MTTRDNNLSDTDIAAIKTKCTNDLSGCGDDCENKIETPKQTLEQSLCNKTKHETCMSQHDNGFKSWFFSSLKFPCSSRN